MRYNYGTGFKKILNVLNELKSDVNTLKTEQVKVNERLTRIEYKVDKLEIGQKEIKENLNGFQDEYTGKRVKL